MPEVRFILDWLLIVLSTWLLYRAVDRMMMQPNSSLGNYVVLVTWVFCSLPIFLDYAIGKPDYSTISWYVPFIMPMADDRVSCVYDALIFVSFLALDLYCNRHSRKVEKSKPDAWGTPLGEFRPILFFGILLPFAYITISGLWSYFAIYGAFGTRNLPAGTSTTMTACLLLSMISFCVWFFKKPRIVCTDICLMAVYSFAVAWVCGKRFMIALMLLLYLFFFLNRDLSQRTRKNLKRLLPLAFCCLVAFSAYYLIGVRPLSDTSGESVYDMLRVDFGRDDVTKYVIYHEFFLGDHILDYPGETFLSTFFVWVPRFLWHAKPFNHYQYLTSSILGAPITNLPAGTTPSWWEMSICNFSYFGFIVAVVGIVAIVWIADKAKTVSTRACALVIVVALMTQSIDAYLSLVLLLIIQFSLSAFVKKRKKAYRELETPQYRHHKTRSHVMPHV